MRTETREWAGGDIQIRVESPLLGPSGCVQLMIACIDGHGNYTNQWEICREWRENASYTFNLRACEFYLSGTDHQGNWLQFDAWLTERNETKKLMAAHLAERLQAVVQAGEAMVDNEDAFIADARRNSLQVTFDTDNRPEALAPPRSGHLFSMRVEELRVLNSPLALYRLPVSL